MTLKELRTNAGLTREQIAKKAFVDVSCITHWELGDWAPSKKYHKKLAKLYGVSETEIAAIAAAIRSANAERN
mgnify:CR=1 FL=1